MSEHDELFFEADVKKSSLRYYINIPEYIRKRIKLKIKDRVLISIRKRM